MNKVILILLSFLFFNHVNAQESVVNASHEVTFKLKITSLPIKYSMGIGWFIGPYADDQKIERSLFPKSPNTDGLYQQTISFPDSLMGKTITYWYEAAHYEEETFNRYFVLDKNKTQHRADSWGYIDGLQGKVKPTSMLFVEPNSVEEKKMFTEPYIGITTNGIPIEDLYPIKKTGASTVPIKNAVIAFVASLTKEQKSASTFPIASNEWRRWHNIENWRRAGVCFEDLNVKQKELALAFLKESLSTQGLQKAKNIMTMEVYLASLVPENKDLGGEKYWFTFMGTPSDTEPWGWKMEGHHLIINYFVLGDQVVMTPTFMGSEPNLVETGDNKGVRTFEMEEKKGLDFYLSLNSKQKEKATIFNKKEFDFNQTEAFRDNQIVPITGISAEKLSKAQQAMLLGLIAEYVNNVRDGQAKVKMAAVKHHLNQTNFTWIQGSDSKSPFYYRIHSPVILIEFDHQSPVFLYDHSKPFSGPVKTHVHTVVRTPNGNDYGKDLLKAHLEKEHKHKKH
jgi:hypothetical protein